MRRGNRPGWISLVILLAAWQAAGDAAAGLSIRAYLDREVMRVGERNMLTVEVSSDQGTPSNPQVPQVDGLGIYPLGGSSTSFNMNVIGGRTVVEYKRTLQYIVVPTREGVFEIKGINVRFGSQRAAADPVSLTVLKVGAPTPTPVRQQRSRARRPLRTGEYRLIAELSKSRVYVGEGVSVRYVLLGTPGVIHQINSFGNLGPALFKRCVVEEVGLKDIRLEPHQIAGQLVERAVLKHFVLFPLSPGPIEVDPVTLGLDVLAGGRRRSIFDFPFQRTLRTTVRSDPLRIEVVPLPTDGKPEDFEGAVGEFKIQAEVDKKELSEGDAFSLRVVVTGSGNIKNCPPPTLPDLSGFDRYESTKKEDVSVTPQGVSGRITYEYVLVTKDVTRTEIGPIRFSYFNPDDNEYHTLATPPINLKINPRRRAPGDRVLLAADAGTKREIVLTGEDFRHIQVGVPGSVQERLDLYRVPLFVCLLVFPLFLVCASLGYASRHRRVESDPEYARHRRAPRMARRSLSQARRAVSAGDRDAAYATFSKALVDYVGDRWNLAAGGMTTRDLGRHLRERGVPEPCVGDLISTLEDFEACRFGGDANRNLGQDLKRTEEVLSRLMAVGKNTK